MADQRYRGRLLVRFWSPSYMPEKALDPRANYHGEYGPTGNEFEIKADGADWRPAKPGATLADLGDWMTAHSLGVIKRQLTEQRNGERWYGLYVLTIALAPALNTSGRRGRRRRAQLSLFAWR